MEWKPKFEWPLSPRRPRCPSAVSSSSSSRLPSFSSDAGDSFVSAEEDCFEEDKRESSVYSKEAIAGGYGGHAALQFVVPTSRYAWWRWRHKPRYHLPNVPDPSRASSKPGAASAHLPLTTCSTNSTLTVTSYKEGSPCDFRLTRTEGEILSSPNLKAFTFYELKSATRNFRANCLIGEGGFGYVFKGWIDEQTFTASKPGSGMVVAVKKLKPEDFPGHREWLTEVNYLGQLHHPNLVKLIGFCSQDDNRLLVYEYMPRGSLNNHLFRRSPQTLSWAVRLKVAIGAAKVLTFLHEAESQVIYRNVKASHILLDSEFNAKLSGFDLARAGPTGDETNVTTRVMGTLGYAAPEYILTGHLSAKADVYSFGVVLLELLSGRPAWDRTKSKAEVDLVKWARPCLRDKRKLYQIMDPKLEGRYPEKGAHFVAMLAKQCISRDPKLRAPMSAVLAALEQLSGM